VAEFALGRSEEHWRRLGWIVPTVFLGWLGLLWMLGLLLTRQPAPTLAKPIDAMLIDLPEEHGPPAEEKIERSPAQIKSPPVPPKPAPINQKPAPTPEVNVSPSPPQPSVSNSAPIIAAPAPRQESTPRQDTSQTVPHTGRAGARALFSPLPRIPDELRDAAMQMEALARFDIKPDGSAIVELAQPTQNPALNRIILETLKTWRFFPAMEGNSPVASTQEIRIHLQVR
jgi:protein TonB